MKLLKNIVEFIPIAVTFTLVLSTSFIVKAGESEDRNRYESIITDLNRLHPDMDRISRQTLQQFNNTFGRGLDELNYFLKEYRGSYQSEYVRGLAEKLAETLNWATRERGRDKLNSDIDELQASLKEREENKEAFRRNFATAFKFIIRVAKETAIEMALDVKSLATGKLPANARRQKLLKKTADQLNSFITGLEKIEDRYLSGTVVNILGQSSSDVENILGERGEGSKLSPYAWVILGLAAMKHLPFDFVGIIEPTYVSALMSATVGFLMPSLMFAAYKMKYGVHRAWEKFIDVRWGFVDAMEAIDNPTKKDNNQEVIGCKASLIAN